MSSKRPSVPALPILALVILLMGGIYAVTAGASDPSADTVSVDKPLTGWQGDTYAVGQTKVADACALPTNTVCDHFELNVDVDPSHWEMHDGGVEVKIAWEDENDDFDLYVYDENGDVVGEAANGGTSSERVFIPKASGTYRVEVPPYAVTDSAYMGGAHVETREKVGQTGGEVPAEPLSDKPCENGAAGPFPCKGVDLEAFLPRDTIGGGELNDIWGWTDPQTGREYALVGKTNGTSFVDISDPKAPVYLGDLPSHQPVETIFNTWRDIKVYKDHAFVVSEEPLHGMQVFDLTRLRGVTEAQTWSEDAHYSFALDGIAGLLEVSSRIQNPPDNAHNIAINEESGFAYAIGTSTCGGGGPHMIDIRDPKNPTFAGCVSEDGYTHDNQCVNYRASDPDPAFAGREICFNSNEDTLTIVDVTDKANPEQLARVPYDGATYTHQAWLTEDRKHILVDDELDEQDRGGQTKTYVFNVERLRSPQYVTTYNGAAESIDHNQYVKGDRTYQANYRSGLRVVDISDIGHGPLSEAGFFDVYPADDAAEFNGAWSNYPYFESGVVVVSGIEQGLFVLRPDAATAGTEQSAPPAPSPAGNDTGTSGASGGSDGGAAGSSGTSAATTPSDRTEAGGGAPGAVATGAAGGKALRTLSFSNTRTSVTLNGKRRFTFRFAGTPGSTGRIAFATTRGAKRKLNLGSKRYRVGENGGATVVVKLSARNAAALKKLRRLPVRATATLDGRTFSRAFVLRAARR